MSQLTLGQAGVVERDKIIIDIPDGERLMDLNGTKIKVSLWKDYFGKAKEFFEGEHYVPHIEIISVEKRNLPPAKDTGYIPPIPNILTETGYRSYFFPFEILEDHKTYEEVVESVLKADNKWVDIKWC